MKSSSRDEERGVAFATGDGRPTGAHRGNDVSVRSASPAADAHHGWRFLTNHARVLETVARDPTTRFRDIGLIVGITERAAVQIVDDLVQAGYVTKTREGRRNRYEVHGELPLRHPAHNHRTAGELLAFLQGSGPGSSDVEPGSFEAGPGHRGS
jgi:hypothetical protein